MKQAKYNQIEQKIVQKKNESEITKLWQKGIFLNWIRL